MKKVVVALLALFGVFCLVAATCAVGLGLLAATATERVPSRVLLEIDFERGILEALPDDPLARLMLEDIPQLRDVVDALDRGAADRRVVGVFARVAGSGIGLAHIQELRDAVARFRASGKPAVAFAESFGEFGPGNGGYYLASAFDEIYLQPSGDVGLTGLIYESPFVRGLLEKLAIRPEIGQRYEYKNAVNFYTERGYTEAHRRAMQELMDSQFEQIVSGIALAREMTEEEVRDLVDRGPHIGIAAVEAGLVDALAYRDEAIDRLRERVDSRAELFSSERYLAAAGRPHRRGTTIALIQGQGAVMSGRSGYSPIDGSVTLGSDTISSAFRDAIDDRRVRAIIFRVDSPGGSFIASDTIWRETVRAQEAHKPVIVSMGNLAGSGGYYVAMNADKIVAQPGTITASIGVYGGKFYTRDFWGKLGITWDDVSTSAHSQMWSARHDWDTAADRFDAMLDRVYLDFTGKVAAARGIPLERVQEIARGRIWTGADAQKLGLVDELGGLDVALRLAREAAGLEPDAQIRIKPFPRPRSAWELIFERGNRVERSAFVAAARMVENLEPALRVMVRLGLLGEDGVLTMPDSVPAP